MDKNELWENISRRVSGESNPAQEKELDEWINSNKHNKKIFDSILDVWNYNPNPVPKNYEIYSKFKYRVAKYNQATKTKSFVYYTLRIAAILFLLVSMTVLVKSYLLPEIRNEVAYQELSVPKGNRSSLILPDGSKVWVSNNSNIKYPVSFSKSSRELFLTGEAYFEVVHNREKPFIVNIGENRIKVLGTKFSVSAYPEDNEVKTDLLSGKIQFDIYNTSEDKYESFIVKPGQSLAYNKTTRVLKESEIPDDFYDYWQKGIYSFKNESMESLAAKIERIYNTEIIFESDYLRTKRYSGSFSINDNIFTFIEAIKQTSVEPIEYKLRGNKLFVKQK